MYWVSSPYTIVDFQALSGGWGTLRVSESTRNGLGKPFWNPLRVVQIGSHL